MMKTSYNGMKFRQHELYKVSKYSIEGIQAVVDFQNHGIRRRLCLVDILKTIPRRNWGEAIDA